MLNKIFGFIFTSFLLCHCFVFAVAPENSNTLSVRAQDVLDFWFGPLNNPAFIPADKKSLWFSDSQEMNQIIRSQFAGDMQRAVLGEYNDWRTTPRGRLALILLLDQFPRRLYQSTPQAFASDAMARGLVLEGLQRKDDQSLYPIERAYFYMPLLHSEDLDSQQLAVQSYTKLVQDAPFPIVQQMESFLACARINQNLISRFHRFPQRNKALKRESTPEENIYLKQRGFVL